MRWRALLLCKVNCAARTDGILHIHHWPSHLSILDEEILAVEKGRKDKEVIAPPPTQRMHGPQCRSSTGDGMGCGIYFSLLMLKDSNRSFR